MMRLKHENLMALTDFQKDENFAYLVMPFAEESLADLI